jgi:tetratricopeptide (TPR) repeat protein
MIAFSERSALAVVFAALLCQAQTSQNALAEANAGVEEAKQQHFSAAIEHYKHAVKLDPNLPGIYLDLGLAYFKSGAFRDALTALQKEEARNPSDQTKTLIAMTYFGLGQYKEAASSLQPIADAQPGNTEILYLLAKCYLWSGQYDKSKEIFRNLLTRDPNSAPVHMLLGEATSAGGKSVPASVIRVRM